MPYEDSIDEIIVDGQPDLQYSAKDTSSSVLYPLYTGSVLFEALGK